MQDQEWYEWVKWIIAIRTIKWRYDIVYIYLMMYIDNTVHCFNHPLFSLFSWSRAYRDIDSLLYDEALQVHSCWVYCLVQNISPGLHHRAPAELPWRETGMDVDAGWPLQSKGQGQWLSLCNLYILSTMSMSLHGWVSDLLVYIQ